MPSPSHGTRPRWACHCQQARVPRGLLSGQPYESVRRAGQLGRISVLEGLLRSVSMLPLGRGGGQGPEKGGRCWCGDHLRLGGEKAVGRNLSEGPMDGKGPASWIMHILSRAPAGAALRAEVHSPTPLWGVILSNSSASGNIPWTVAQGHILEFLLQMGWVWPWGSSQPQPVLSQAHIRFKPTLSQQKSPGQEDTVLNGNFIIRYDVNRTLSGGSIQVCGLQARIGATRKSIHTQGLELTCSRRKGKVTAPTHQCEPVAAQTKNKQFCYVVPETIFFWRHRSFISAKEMPCRIFLIALADRRLTVQFDVQWQ